MTKEHEPNWQKLSTLNKVLAWPPGYTVSELQRSEVSQLVEKINQWNPFGVAGEALRFVDIGFYNDEVSFAEYEKRETQVYIGKYENDIAFMFSLEHDPRTRTMHGSYGIVAPSHQKSGIGLVTVQVIEHQAAALNCSVISSYATLETSVCPAAP